MNVQFETLGLQTGDKRMLRAGKWEVPEGTECRGICILLHGLTEFLEKYGEVAEELAGRGFSVISVDWRSQGASERRVRGNRTGHVADFNEYDQDIGMLVQQLAFPTGLPMIALAHSMGGHVLLRYLHDHKRRFVCAVLCAPMIDIQLGEQRPWLVHLATFFINLRRASGRLIFGSEEHDPLAIPFEDNCVTSDRGRYERTLEYLKAKPFLRIYGPSFGWLRAAFRSMRRLRRKGFAEEIVAPVLIIGAGKDRVVKTEAIREYVAHLPKAEYVEIEESEHEILMERDSIRAKFWAAFDAFVGKHLAAGGRPPPGG